MVLPCGCGSALVRGAQDDTMYACTSRPPPTAARRPPSCCARGIARAARSSSARWPTCRTGIRRWSSTFASCSRAAWRWSRPPRCSRSSARCHTGMSPPDASGVMHGQCQTTTSPAFVVPTGTASGSCSVHAPSSCAAGIRRRPCRSSSAPSRARGRGPVCI